MESREYRPLGSTETKYFTGRVVAATNRSLAEQVKAGRFREDLMYRLDVTTIRIPPLRERLSDIAPLAEFLLTQLCAKYERRKPALRPADLQALCGYSFPGNVRELRNLLERSLLRTDDSAPTMIMDLGWMRSPASPAPVVATTPPTASTNGEVPPPPHNLSPIDLQEYQLIQKTLREEGGAIRRSAAKLGLTHQALLRRLQKWPELREGLGTNS